MKNQAVAHLRESDREPQYLWEHLKEASLLAGRFASKVGLKDAGEILGILHDLGKASEEFQRYLGSAVGLINPDEDGYIDAAKKKGEIDHSTAGAQVLWRRLSGEGPVNLAAGQLLSLCLASHHSGLIDCLSPEGENKFFNRMEKREERAHADEAVLALTKSEEQEILSLLSRDIGSQIVGKLHSLREEKDTQDTLAFKFGLLVRFLFSCLIDADRLSTVDFETPDNARIRNSGEYASWETLVERLEDKIQEFDHRDNKNEVDQLRKKVSDTCLSFSQKTKGIYQLTVPTGGGKTLASLRFALNHAARHKMDRVFYIIPFTSIIDQNADEVRKILEDRDASGNFLGNVVLEHHSNLTPEEETRRQNLLSENWDAPVVFTTQVQFLETLFGAGTRSVRRMHQLANAVIIFDEVQTIPVRCVHLFNMALRFLVKGCGSTIVLCTATQPLLHRIDPPQYALNIGIEQRVIQNEQELFRKLKRVEVHDCRRVGGWRNEDIAALAEQELRGKGNVLIVVNTKKSARSLYKAIKERNIPETYHLSTNMCPAHRLQILSVVKEKLHDEKPVICVSTQLIEAGVDIDFGSVIRYMAGLDSIVQAAGRCNRHGRKGPGNVWVVNPQEENIARLKDIAIGRGITERVLAEFSENPGAFDGDPLGPAALERFYQYYFYDRKGEMCYRIGKNSLAGREDNLFNLLSMNRLSAAEHERINHSAPSIPFWQSFKTAAKAFYAIDSPTRGVVAPYGDAGREIVKQLRQTAQIGKQYRLLKQAQRYSVNLLPHEFERMTEKQAVREVQEGSGVFYLEEDYYNEQFGWQAEIEISTDVFH